MACKNILNQQWQGVTHCSFRYSKGSNESKIAKNRTVSIFTSLFEILLYGCLTIPISSNKGSNSETFNNPIQVIQVYTNDEWIKIRF